MKNSNCRLRIILILLMPLIGCSSVKAQDYILHFMMHDGFRRSYYQHLPINFDKSKSLPLVIVLHGGRGTGKGMIGLTENGFNNLADNEKFIVVYPNGIGKNWNDGRLNMPSNYKAHNQNIDDVGFISALIDEMVKKYNADAKRIYVTGMSNGAMMTERLAIELSDKIAAAAPICGNIPADLKSIPKNKVAMFIINGTDDPLVPFDGGYVHFFKKQLGKVISTKETVAFWVKNNNINSTPATINLPDNDFSDGCTEKQTIYGSSSDSGEVILITIEHGGHTWPGGLQYLNEKIIGKTCRDFNACQMIWNFFKMHSK